jgi:LacI family gluconate utilization system Gnt-I transcriptional repressor
MLKDSAPDMVVLPNMIRHNHFDVTDNIATFSLSTRLLESFVERAEYWGINQAMNEQRRWVTMDDVARQANVSKITVSRVLRTPGKVSEGTRERVQAAIRSLGYVLDEAAGSLSSRKARTVGALISTLNGSIFTSTVNGLSSTLRPTGYQLLLANTDYSSHNEESFLSPVLGHRPAGLVLTSTTHTQETRALLSGSGIPVVELWEMPENPICHSVGFSNFAAGYAITAFLHETGRRHIGFIGSRSGSGTRVHQRAAGYLKALDEVTKQTPRNVEGAEGSTALEVGALGLSRLLATWPDTDAVFCVNDSIAFGAIIEAGRRGLRVPDDIAVTGFGDFEFANEFGLGLTTVRIPGFEIGRLAAELILDETRAPLPAPRTIDVGFEIVRRRTA